VNCHTVSGLGRLGPAADYQIQARDPNTGIFHDVPFVRHSRTVDGAEINTFGTAGSPIITTDQIVILLNARELGVDYYSLREVALQNGGEPMAFKLPTSLNHLAWDSNYEVLRAFDGDPDTQWVSATQGMIGALDVVGNNVKLTGLKIIGFGTKATRECFPMGMVTPPPWYPPAIFGNVLIENCVLTQPATHNTDGITTVIVVGFLPHNLTNAVVRSCTIASLRSYFPVSQGFAALHVENCLVSDCQKAVYSSPMPIGLAMWGRCF